MCVQTQTHTHTKKSESTLSRSLPLPPSFPPSLPPSLSLSLTPLSPTLFLSRSDSMLSRPNNHTKARVHMESAHADHTLPHRHKHTNSKCMYTYMNYAQILSRGRSRLPFLPQTTISFSLPLPASNLLAAFEELIQFSPQRSIIDLTRLLAPSEVVREI